MIKIVKAQDEAGSFVQTIIFDEYPLLDGYLKTHTGEIVAVQQVADDEFYIHSGDYTLDNIGYEAPTEDGEIHRAFVVVSNSGTFMWGLVNSNIINQD